MTKIKNFIKNWRKVDEKIQAFHEIRREVEEKLGEHTPEYRHKNNLLYLMDLAIIMALAYYYVDLAHRLIILSVIPDSVIGKLGFALVYLLLCVYGACIYVPFRRADKRIPATPDGIKTLDRALDYYHDRLLEYAKRDVVIEPRIAELKLLLPDCADKSHEGLACHSSMAVHRQLDDFQAEIRLDIMVNLEDEGAYHILCENIAKIRNI